MKISIIFSLFLTFSLHAQHLYSQTGGAKKTVKQKAHDKKTAEDEFSLTEDEKFQFNVYTVDEKSMTDRTHHWFIEVKDMAGKPLNYAKINLSGYLKSDPNVKFNYVNPVFSLCNEGKYVIGFVRVNRTGPWVLEAELKSKDIKDNFICEINIKEKS